jgi:hypothetical protein
LLTVGKVDCKNSNQHRQVQLTYSWHSIVNVLCTTNLFQFV